MIINYLFWLGCLGTAASVLVALLLLKMIKVSRSETLDYCRKSFDEGRVREAVRGALHGMVMPAHGTIVGQPEVSTRLIQSSCDRLRLVESMSLSYGKSFQVVLGELRIALEFATEAVEETSKPSGDARVVKRKATEAWLLFRHAMEVLDALNNLESLSSSNQIPAVQ